MCTKWRVVKRSNQKELRDNSNTSMEWILFVGIITQFLKVLTFHGVELCVLCPYIFVVENTRTFSVLF